MIPHQAQGLNLPIGPGTNLVVGVIPEDGFAPVAAIDELVDRPFELNPQLARYGGWLPAFRRCVSIVRTDPDQTPTHDPAWLSDLLKQGHPIYCGFDADPTGDAMAQRLRDLYPSVQRLRPQAKDWNDLLRQLGR